MQSLQSDPIGVVVMGRLRGDVESVAEIGPRAIPLDAVAFSIAANLDGDPQVAAAEGAEIAKRRQSGGRSGGEGGSEDDCECKNGSGRRSDSEGGSKNGSESGSECQNGSECGLVI